MKNGAEREREEDDNVCHKDLLESLNKRTNLFSVVISTRTLFRSGGQRVS